MEDEFQNYVWVGNPPWVNRSEPDESNCFTVTTNWDLQFTDLLREKLVSIDTSQSIELRRQVLLAAHDCGHQQIKWLDFDDLELKPLLYDAYGAPTSFRSFHEIGHIVNHLTVEQVEFLQSPEALHFRKWLLLNLVFDLIDRVVDYWNDVALTRRAWRSVSRAFRRLLESALQFKPFHTPLRLFPSSIHPIDSAA